MRELCREDSTKGIRADGSTLAEPLIRSRKPVQLGVHAYGCFIYQD